VAGAPASADVGACARTVAHQKRAGRAPKLPAEATACAAAAVRGLRLAPGALPGQQKPNVAAAPAPLPPSDARQQAIPQQQAHFYTACAPSTAIASAAAALQAPACHPAQLPAAIHVRRASGSQPQRMQASCGLAEADMPAEDAVPGSPVASPALSDVALSQTPPRATGTGAAALAARSTAESRPPAEAVPCCAAAATPPTQPIQQCATGPYKAITCLAFWLDACSCTQATPIGTSDHPPHGGDCRGHSRRRTAMVQMQSWLWPLADYIRLSAAYGSSQTSVVSQAPAVRAGVSWLVCRYALVKVGTEDGKLRLVTQSEARRVRRRIDESVTSPGANGRSRRVAADPEQGLDTQPALCPVSGQAAAACAALQAPRSRAQQTSGGGQEQTSCAAPIGQSAGPLPAAVGPCAGGSFSEQLNAALRAVHAPDVPPAWVPAPAAPTDASLLMSQQLNNTGGPVATALVAVCDVQSNPEYLDGTALPPLLPGIAAEAIVYEASQRKTGSRSRQKAATREQDGQLPKTGMTNRGRVRQRGSKRAELLRVGRLR